ncbi:pumilio homolog 12-like [Pyrus x bretschneideri]|uniref:pumilio homolog 12-like n=1 Tax=Pyrus x bretschneideri TaxID=225117 RepID=UPI00202F739F|nr:pumilio homolog 12-like [Pyrus x bretschneideri]XP_048436166.1 pumilio homolog 12-like [Pyrus x bretschneideri]
MKGFRGFPETASLWAPEFSLPECVPGSSSLQNHIGGESHSDQTLEAAFSRLNVSAFSRQQSRISGIDGGDYSNGPALNYPSSDHGFSGGNSMPFCGGEALQSRLNSQNGGGGDLGNFGRENCWVGNGSNGFVPNQDCWVHSDIAGFQKPLDRLSLADLRGNISALAKQQHGCRFLQKTMEDAPNRDVIDLIFLEIMENVVVLMLDPYGNYVVQKLVEVCTEEQRTRMLSKLILESHASLVCIALDTRGTRTVQKLLQYVTSQEQVSLIMGALSPAAAVLSKNNNWPTCDRTVLREFF